MGAGSYFIGCHDGRLDPRVEGAAVVAIDVIRASTTAITAAALGWSCRPVATLAEARAMAAGPDRPLLAGELGGIRPCGFDLQNSPAEVVGHEARSRPLVLLSTSGTPLMVAAADRGPTYLACLRNAAATARRLAEGHRRIAILGADPKGTLRREDRLCAARVGAGLRHAGFEPEDELTERIMEESAEAPDTAILGGRSARYLESSGQRNDLDFILTSIEDLEGTFSMVDGVVVPEPL